MDPYGGWCGEEIAVDISKAVVIIPALIAPIQPGDDERGGNIQKVLGCKVA